MWSSWPATRTVKSALVEMSAGFRSVGPSYIEAVVGTDNSASQKVAERGMGGVEGRASPMVYRDCRRCSIGSAAR
jgi:hypothetical protein